MDRYLLARTRTLAADVRRMLEAYDVPGACQAIREHLDVLTNWYVRTSRDRFWDEDEAAFNTLHTALEVLMRVMAPLAPLITEEVWRGLTGGRSVHLTDWPVLDEAFAADELVATMDRVRDVVSTTLGLRKAGSLRVRQPLRTLQVVVEEPEALEPFTGLVADEVNVKAVELQSLAGDTAQEHGVYTKLTVNARAAGPRLGKDVQRVIKAARSGAWEQTADGGVVVDGIALEEAEYTLTTEVEDRPGDERAAGVLDGGGFVVLDTALDDELLAEGFARDLVRRVQDERKAAGLHVTDRITLAVDVPGRYARWIENHADLGPGETLAVSLAADGTATAERAVRLEPVQARPTATTPTPPKAPAPPPGAPTVQILTVKICTLGAEEGVTRTSGPPRRRPRPSTTAPRRSSSPPACSPGRTRASSTTSSPPRTSPCRSTPSPAPRPRTTSTASTPTSSPAPPSTTSSPAWTGSATCWSCAASRSAPTPSSTSPGRTARRPRRGSSSGCCASAACVPGASPPRT